MGFFSERITDMEGGWMTDRGGEGDPCLSNLQEALQAKTLDTFPS